MRQPTRWWSRKFYVHPIQRKYFFLSLVPLVVCAFLLILLVFIPLNFTLLGEAGDPERAATLRQIYALGVWIWPAVLLSVLASGLLSFLATNRFAGPLHRIERIAQAVAEGQFPHSIRVRRNDDLGVLAGLLDRAFGKVGSALRGIREQQGLADRELAILHGKVKAGLRDPGEVLQGLEQIGHRHRAVEKILAGFRVPAREDLGSEPDSETAPPAPSR